MPYSGEHSTEWPAINPGQMRDKVKIQAVIETRDEFNQPKQSWPDAEDTPSRFAYVEQLTGRELFSARQIHAEVTHRIVVRWLDGVTPRHRVLLGSRAFDILSAVSVDNRNVLLEIMAKERIGTAGADNPAA